MELFRRPLFVSGGEGVLATPSWEGRRKTRLIGELEKKRKVGSGKAAASFSPFPPELRQSTFKQGRKGGGGDGRTKGNFSPP